MDFDLMRFYQTYVKYAILVNERRDAFSIAKVMHATPLMPASPSTADILCTQSRFRRHIEVPDGIEGTRIHFSLRTG